MSEKYNEYIKEHRENVFKAYQWLEKNLPELFTSDQFKAECRHLCEFEHDRSKFCEDEYEAYDAYFYGGNRSYSVVQNFNRAWLLHIHRNPHHWQYWILRNDDPELGEILINMPDKYVVEMICDWLSFSIAKGDLREILKWYEERKDHIKLSDITRETVEGILAKIQEKLSESDVNEKE